MIFAAELVFGVKKEQIQKQMSSGATVVVGVRIWEMLDLPL